MTPAPRVMAIHDISGVGKCSLTVALPVLAAMGIETAALPTAVLSTHTGGIAGYTYRDLTADMLPMAEHWRSLGLRFDALYSGWLGSPEQDRIVSSIIEMFSDQRPLRLVDPVMGDHGRLYSTYTPDRVQGMAALCGRADVITPNLTEASFLLGIPYEERSYAPDEALALCRRLTALGAGAIVVTGIATHENTLGAASLDVTTGAFGFCEMPRLPGIWHGTGDVFGAVLLGGLLWQWPLERATALAVRFTRSCIARTYKLGTDPRFGVAFEQCLPELLEAAREKEGTNG